MQDCHSIATAISYPSKIDNEDNTTVQETSKTTLSMLNLSPYTTPSFPSTISQKDHDNKDNLDESTYPSYVATTSVPPHSPISTVTLEHNATAPMEKAIDLSLKFFKGTLPLPLPNSPMETLLPGIQYESFQLPVHGKIVSNIDPTLHISKEQDPGGQDHGQVLCQSLICANGERDGDSDRDPNDESTSIVSVNVIPTSLMSESSRYPCLSNDRPCHQGHQFTKISTTHNTIAQEGARSKQHSKNDSDEDNDDDDDDDGGGGDEDSYEYFEHTLSDFEETVATLSDPESEDSSSSGDESESDRQPKVYDPTGLLSAVDRILDCLDPQLTNEDRSQPHVFDREKSLDSRFPDLDWEVAMKRDDVEWLFPCCDDTGIDNDLDDSFQGSGVEHSSSKGGLSYSYSSSTFGAMSTVGQTLESRNAYRTKGFSDKTMMTDTDITWDLSD